MIDRAELEEDFHETLAADYQESEKDLSHFFQASWDVLEPETQLFWNWHHDLVSEHLMACDLGEIHRLIINIPPRTTKSLMGTVCFPSWVWTRKPGIRFMFGSYADTLARKHSLLRRDLIQSPWYQGGWKHRFKLAEDQNVKTNFKNDKTGHMISASMLGSVTGEGGDYVIIDDPHNPKKARSDTEREAALMAFDQAWSTRLNNKKTGRIIVIMQRLHEKDLTGHLLAKNAGYVHVKVPQIAEKKTIIVMPLSKTKITREVGDLLDPKREGKAEIEQTKIDLGSYGFAGQQQQDPAPSGGGLLKRKWWKFYKVLPDRLDEKLISMDTTFEDTENSDYVVAQAWGRVGANKYLIDQIRDHMDFVTAVKAFKAFHAKHSDVNSSIIEKKANGPAIISTLSEEIPGLIAYNPEVSKVLRVAAISPQVEAGNVYLPDPSICPWINDFIEECTKFPKGIHDDQVDTMAQALLRFQESAAGVFLENMEDSSQSIEEVTSGGDYY